MTVDEKEAFIRVKCAERRADAVLWSSHAIVRLAALPWSREETEAALSECTIIEDYGDAHRGLPDCLALAYLAGRPVHAVVAIDIKKDRVLIVTAYAPSISRWEDDWRTRK